MTQAKDVREWWPTPDELDIDAVSRGLITEEERISRAYDRIFARQLKRGLTPPPRTV